jgi:hypothetical protein
MISKEIDVHAQLNYNYRKMYLVLQIEPHMTLSKSLTKQKIMSRMVIIISLLLYYTHF